MPFNAELAQKVVDSRNRDKALFFAGRGREIASFESALRQSKSSEQAVFRIYQGPPGCGKTSLAHYLRETFSDRTLFIKIGPDEEFNRKALGRRFFDESTKKSVAPPLQNLAAAAANRFLGEPITTAVEGWIVKAKTKSLTVVVHIDEAHALGVDREPTLRSLHEVGAGVPCVVLLSGLEPAEERITSIDGLSRLSDDAVVTMSSLEDRHCVESTKKMLRELGDQKDLHNLGELSAELSRGWPAHLHSAQKAICKNLIEAGGDYRRLDFARIKKRTDEMRHQYYESRLKSVFPKERKLLLHIISEIKDKAPLPLNRIDEICQTEKLKHSVRPHHFAPEQVSDLLIGKGVLTKAGNDYSLAIPSMGEWAKNQIERSTPSENQTGLRR